MNVVSVNTESRHYQSDEKISEKCNSVWKFEIFYMWKKREWGGMVKMQTMACLLTAVIN